MAVTRLLLVAFVCVGSARIGFGAESVDQELLRKIHQGWLELEQLDTARPAIDLDWSRHELDGPKKGSTKSGSSYLRRSAMGAKVSNQSGRTDEAVVNSKCMFIVSRDSDTQPWTLKDVELDLLSEKTKLLQENVFLVRITLPTSFVFVGPFAKEQRSPKSLVSDPKFTVTATTPLTDGLVRIRYQYEGIAGELDCDPARHYMIRRGRATEKNPAVQYDLSHERQLGSPELNGEVIVSRLEYEVTSNRGAHFRDVTNYSYPDQSKTGELGDERFRLSAYGLPEPEGVVWDTPRRWLPYWLAGAGVLIVLVTTWLLRRARWARPVEARP
jgi:hypothetical protein